MIEAHTIAGAGPTIFLTLAIVSIIQGDLGAAGGNLAAGLSLGALLLWDRRSAPRRIAANRRRRQALIREPELWTDEELWTIRTSDDFDLLGEIAARARQRRTEEAERWFVSHFFEHGPDWEMSVDGGEPVPVTVQRYGDLLSRLSTRSDLNINEHSLSAEVFAKPSWRRVVGSPGRAKQGESTLEFRPAHCRCVMPSWRTDTPASAPLGYLEGGGAPP